MATFKATYKDIRGRDRSLRIQASDATSAKRILRRRGFTPTGIERDIQSVSSTSKRNGAQKKEGNSILSAPVLERRPSISEKAIFANKLAALVDAGVPIVRGIDLMSEQQKGSLFRRALKCVSDDVREGSTLANAMRRWPKVFDRLTIPMVEAGEAGGVLDETLRRLAKLLEDNAKLQNQLRGAMIYPIAVFSIAILVFLGMTIFIVPIFAELYSTLKAELPWFTQFMVDFSELLRSPFSLVFIIIIFALIWLFGLFYSTPSGRRIVDRFLLKLPLFGDLVLKSSTAQFCRTFSALTKAGVPILSSLEIVKDTTSNTIISDAILRSKNNVMAGIPLSDALQQQKVLPSMALSMLAIGEETGEVDKMLSKVGDFYEDEVATLVKGLTALLEPIMIIIVGGIVAAILISLYLPMFSIYDQIRA
jgi:type IV pilus assembly protein PilC